MARHTPILCLVSVVYDVATRVGSTYARYSRGCDGSGELVADGVAMTMSCSTDRKLGGWRRERATRVRVVRGKGDHGSLLR